MNGYICGLDLGQASDPTAVALLRSSDSDQQDLYGWPLPRFDCVFLHQFPLGTPYPEIVQWVVKLFSDSQLHYLMNHATFTTEHYFHPLLGIDATGVGRPVVDMFIDANPDAEVLPTTITAGDTSRKDRWNQSSTEAYWVPKKELVGSVQSGLQSGRLRFNPTLYLADLLKKELLNFKVKVSLAGNESFGAGGWREGLHDDLVLAVALGVWLGSRPERFASWGPAPVWAGGPTPRGLHEFRHFGLYGRGY